MRPEKCTCNACLRRTTIEGAMIFLDAALSHSKGCMESWETDSIHYWCWRVEAQHGWKAVLVILFLKNTRESRRNCYQHWCQILVAFLPFSAVLVPSDTKSLRKLISRQCFFSRNYWRGFASSESPRKNDFFKKLHMKFVIFHKHNHFRIPLQPKSLHH